MLIYGIVIILINAVIVVISKLAQSENKSKNHLIRLHKVYLIIGIIGVIFSTTIGLVAAYMYDELWFTAVCAVLMLLFTSIIAGYYGFYVKYDEKVIRYRYFFEKEKLIKYSDIERVRNGLDLEIYSKETNLKVQNYMTGKNEFYMYIKERVTLRQTKVTSVPKVRRYKDSVERPNEIIAISIVVSFLDMISIFFLIYCFDQFTSSQSGIVVFCILSFLIVSLPLLVFLMIHSAKRAHSSSFWNKIAHKLYKPGYLKEDDAYEEKN